MKCNEGNLSKQIEKVDLIKRNELLQNKEKINSKKKKKKKKKKYIYIYIYIYIYTASVDIQLKTSKHIKNRKKNVVHATNQS